MTRRKLVLWISQKHDIFFLVNKRVLTSRGPKKARYRARQRRKHECDFGNPCLRSPVHTTGKRVPYSRV